MGLFRSTRTMSSTSDMSGMGRPEYNRRIDHLRRVEYPMLEGRTYLDHAGTALTCKSLLTTFSQQMQRYLLANPHSAISSRPSDSEKIVSNTRLKVLDMFKADPEHFDVVFVANATAGIKLVMEGFSGHNEGYNYYYHRDCHTSLVGVRELSYQSHCFATDEETKTWIDTGKGSLERGNDIRSTLFAYPGQSNLNGRRLPLDWSSLIRSSEEHRNTYTLLDAAALITTSPIDLSDHNAAPDFVVLSFYKIFGFPDLGALLVRKASAHVLDHRKYFGGGTTEMITCIGDPWVVRKNTSIHARWEDGTGAIRSQLALSCAIDVHQQLYGGLAEVSKHVSWLAQQLYQKLSAIQHSNGLPVCCIYKDPASTYGDAKTQGGTVALNLRRSDGTWFSGWECGAIAIARNIHVRTGAMCNPAGAACALGLTAHELQKAFDSGFRCNQKLDVRNGIPMGMVRVSLGAISILEDVDVFVKFIEECFVDEKLERSDGDSRTERNPSSEVGEMSGGYHEEDPRLKPANTKPENSYQKGAFASPSRFKFGRLKILRSRWKAFRCLG